MQTTSPPVARKIGAGYAGPAVAAVAPLRRGLLPGPAGAGDPGHVLPALLTTCAARGFAVGPLAEQRLRP
jgi:hypothetical protein